MSETPQQQRFFHLAAPCLLLLTPFVVFLKHASYPLLRAETLLCFGVILGVGLVLGLLMIFGGAAVRALILAILVTYVLDMQGGELGMKFALAAFLGFAVVAWPLRRHVTRIATVVGIAMLLTTLAVPGGVAVSRHGSLVTNLPTRSDLPFILHLVLDEHIGIEGIPAEFDPEGRLAANLRDFFLENGFELYGRAYSRYSDTYESVSNAFNFDASATPSRHFAAPFQQSAVFSGNAWFDVLRHRGYRLHVVQSDYVHYVASAPDDGQDQLSVVNYTAETIASLEDAPLALVEKARFIGGSYLRLNDAYQRGLHLYTRLRRRLSTHGIALPPSRDSYSDMSTLSSQAMFAQLRVDLRHAGPGRMYMAHLLLPHYPYAYRANGRLRPPGDWLLGGYEWSKAPRRNDDTSRANSYAQYLEQLQFTRDELARTFAVLRNAHQWDNAVIIVHGDHGSRITLDFPNPENRDRLSDADRVDTFSTLFAVKRPGRPARYDRRLLPLDRLFARILRDAEDPGDPKVESQPFAFLNNKRDSMTRVAIPDFRRDLPPVRLK